MAKPRLMIITGQPGSGKTTLAKKLAAAIHCPLLCRDEFKAGYVHTHGTVEAVANLAVYDAFFAAIGLLLAKEISLMVEAAFQHKVWAPKLEPLQKTAVLRLIICHTDPELASQRRRRRTEQDPTWHQFHGDTDARLAEQPVLYQPPTLTIPTLMVNTTTEYEPDFDQIVDFLHMKSMKQER